MKTLKFSTLLVALAAVFTFSSCLDDSGDSDMPSFTSYVTITGDAAFGYKFHSDYGCTLIPTSASVQEVLPGLSNSNVKRAVVAFDVVNGTETITQLERGKTYNIVLRSYYYANYAIPTYSTINLGFASESADSLTTLNDRLIDIDQNIWAVNGYLNAALTVEYDVNKTFYMHTYFDPEKDVDIDNNALYLNLYYNHNSTSAMSHGSSVFSFDLPEEVAYEFTSDSLDLILRGITSEFEGYSEKARCKMAVKDLFKPSMY